MSESEFLTPAFVEARRLQLLELEKTDIKRLNSDTEMLDAHRHFTIVIKLPEIRQALVRISSDTYGYCVECDDIILESRLVAKPEAVRCFGCQQTRERDYVFKLPREQPLAHIMG